MLHGGDSGAWAPLLREIAEYLNEYDDACEGNWFAASPSIINRIASDEENLRLLGLEISEAEEKCSEVGVVAALLERGNVVCLADPVQQVGPDHPNTFHAGVGKESELLDSCHITINPDRIEHGCIARIVGDVFLEWLNCDARLSWNSPYEAEMKMRQF